MGRPGLIGHEPRGSYKQALDAVYRVLKRESKNGQARAELKRIQLIMATAQ